jgi:hypothetical protein
MSVIRQTVTDRHGKTTRTSYRPNKFENFLLELLYRRVGRRAGWWLADILLRRKGN